MAHSNNFSKAFLRIAAGLSFAAVILGSSPLQAGTVTSFGGASGPGLASLSFNNIFFSTANNDDVSDPSPNIIAVHQKAYSSISYIDMVFNVEDSGGVTEYRLTEGVDNGTGIDWTDYHLQLGFGIGTSFVPSTPGDGLDFDAPDFDAPYIFAPFTTVVATEDDIDIFGGTFFSGDFAVFEFPIDVPDGITSFTVRQFPTIPEPGSLALALLGCMSLSVLRRRRAVTAPRAAKRCEAEWVH